MVRIVVEIMSTVLAILRGPLDILVEISNRQFDVYGWSWRGISIFLGRMIFKAKRLDEITLNTEAEREEIEVRKMEGINKGDRATAISTGAGEPRVGSRKPQGPSVSRRL